MELLKAESIAENREALATGRLDSGWFNGRPSTENDRSAARNRSAFTALGISPISGNKESKRLGMSMSTRKCVGRGGINPRNVVLLCRGYAGGRAAITVFSGDRVQV